MNQKDCQSASCFGRLECVFPKGADGLRHTPQACRGCQEKIECLRSALRGKDGIIVQEEKLARAQASGHIGFVERWARKKALARRKQRKAP